MNGCDFKEELEACREHLEGEEILWMGRPAARVDDGKEGIIAAVIFVGAVILTLTFRTTEAYITGGAFILFAFLFCGGTEISEDALREHTFYIITNRKILRKQGEKIDFVYTTHHHELEVSVDKNGLGTIKFLDAIVKVPMSNFRKETEKKCFFYLDNIPNVRNVEKLIRDLGEREYSQ